MFSSRKTKILLFVVLCLSASAWLIHSTLYKPHPDIVQMDVDFEGRSKALLELIQKDAAAWQNKVVVLQGEASQASSQHLVLDQQVFCQFLHPQGNTLKGNVRIKGRLIGYDDLLEEIKMDQCVLLNH